MAGAYIKNPSRNEFIGIVAALMALNSLAIDIMLPALPYMSEAFGIQGVNNQQYVISAYMFGYGFGEIIFGPVSDKFGRRSPPSCRRYYLHFSFSHGCYVAVF
ncbi:MFS transporter [Enterobacter sp. ASE]|uniref:MFS transporter n=1 Tax=Enterobacter sp. ASE TaxID=2905968 RepID=UPI001E5D81B7|nr:MFS transporter [Enterobacter sp. ASE]MCE3115199.1 MFS transporter [Enterobacter sp. ASE]